MNSNRLPVPLLLLLGTGVMLVGGIGPNFTMALLATVVLLAALGLLWRPGETPVLLFIVSLQWLQASVKIFYGNWLDVKFEELAEFGGNIDGAAVLSLLALFVLTLGIRWGQGNLALQMSFQSRSVALSYSASVWFQLYWIALLVSLVCFELAGIVSGLSQPLLALAELKWAFFFMLGYAVFVGKGLGKGYFLLVMIFEFLLSIGGYFSEFKTVFLVSAMAVLASGISIRPGKVFLVAVLGASLIFLGIIWTSIKVDYRSFVSGGEKAQIVTVGVGERLEELALLVSQVDDAQFQEGARNFISRLSYVDFFGLVLDNVPTSIAHTNGSIWWDAIARPFMPRAFFPNKTEIHDSERTSLYSGRLVSGVEQGTSISIGYIAETYIDFGKLGMMFPLLGFGYLIGRTYRWMVVSGPLRGLLGMGVATASFMNFSFLESSITKTFGGFVAALLVIWLFGRFIAPKFLPGLLLVSGPTTAVSSARPRTG